VAKDTDQGLPTGTAHQSGQTQGPDPTVSTVTMATENGSTVLPSPVELPSITPGHGQRPARALLGWMAPGQGELAMVSNQIGVPLSPEQRVRLDQARAGVAVRPPDVDQREVVSALPSTLGDHVDRLRATSPGAQMFLEGWEVAMVDLTEVVAFQPVVFTDTAAERVANVDISEVEAVAEYTLPTVHVPQIATQQSNDQNVLIFTSPSPNLRVIGNFHGPVPQAGGMPGGGFVVAEVPSFVQVIGVGGRYILRDGYHRAFGLISRGVTTVPAFVRSFEHLNGLVPDGMLPHEAWMGDRPPLLTDYHDEVVAETVYLPAAQKVIIVQALEIGLAS
jgi:hypothetical protein